MFNIYYKNCLNFFDEDPTYSINYISCKKENYHSSF